MVNLQQFYKENRLASGCSEESRLLRTRRHEATRRKKRTDAFNENRNIPLLDDTTKNEGEQSKSVVQNRSTRILKWKIEREKRKKMEQLKKRPPFVVGIVHHKIYSPAAKDETAKTAVNKAVPKEVAAPPRITRATAKRLRNKMLEMEAENSLIEKPKPLNKEQEIHPALFSPYIVSSRGKSNARKEQELKRGFSFGRSQDNNIPTKDTVMKMLNISVEDEERTAQYFQFLLDREVARLTELCKKWQDIKEENTVPEDGQYDINQAIEQTNLLISKKFERFRRLVADCETGKGEMLVTCKDLQGFWDSLYMQIKDCDARFEKLEELRSRVWVEEQPSHSEVVPVAKKKIATKTKTKKPENKRPSLPLQIPLAQAVNAESPRTAMKISKLCKTPIVQSDKSISYINSNQTPRKSILKTPKNSTAVKCIVKSTSKVNFNDCIVLNEVPIDKEDQIKKSLSAALARIDNFDFDS